MSPLFPLILTILLSIISLISILGNLLIIISITTQRFLRTTPNMYILSLSTVDLLMGSILLPLRTTQLGLRSWIFGPVVCTASMLALISYGALSLLHMAAIALDRYYTISGGVSYIQNRGWKRIMLHLTLIWAFGIAAGFFPVIAWNSEFQLGENNRCLFPMTRRHLWYANLYGVPIPTLTLFLYCKLYLKLKQFIGCDKLLKKESEVGLVCEVQKTRAQKQLEKERNAAKILGFVLFGFLCCWCPYIITTWLFLGNVLSPTSARYECVGWLACSSSALNPFIYTIFSPDFRKGFRNLFRRAGTRNNSTT